MSTVAKTWLQAARPATLWAAVGPVAVGAGVAQNHGCLSWAPLLAALWGALWIQIGTNFANDLFDADKGADGPDRLGPQRAVSAGLITRRQMALATALSFALATAAGLYLWSVAGNWVIWVGLASLISGLWYTGGPMPLAYIGAGDLFVWVFFGFVAVAGTAAAQCGAVPVSAWWAGAAVGALNTAILVVNNLRDRVGDARVGKRTLAVRFGERFARAEYVVLLAVAYVVSGLWAWTSGDLWSALPLVTLPLAWRVTSRVLREDGTSLNPLLGQTARLVLVYSLLLAAGLFVS